MHSHTHIHTHAYTCTHTHIHTHTHTQTHIHIHTHTHTGTLEQPVASVDAVEVVSKFEHFGGAAGAVAKVSLVFSSYHIN